MKFARPLPKKLTTWPVEEPGSIEVKTMVFTKNFRDSVSLSVIMYCFPTGKYGFNYCNLAWAPDWIVAPHHVELAWRLE